jgi:hypothetical protein
MAIQKNRGFTFYLNFCLIFLKLKQIIKMSKSSPALFKLVQGHSTHGIYPTEPNWRDLFKFQNNNELIQLFISKNCGFIFISQN